MKTYIKKPDEFKAVQFTGKNEREVMKLLRLSNMDINVDWDGNKVVLLDKKKALKGDWVVIPTHSYNFYVLTDKQFKDVYQVKEEERE